MSGSAEQDERKLVQEAVGGDKRAFEGLVDLYQDRVYNLSYRLTGRQDLAWDLSQEAFMRAYAAISGFKAEAGFYTHPEARGKGVLGEAFPAAVRYAFDKLGFRRLTLFAADSNEGSKKLARIAGFREFGTQKLAARSDGVFEDLVGFELFRDDYEADRKD